MVAASKPELIHATVVEIDGNGVMIAGPSGSGKTLLALELLHRCRLAGVAAALVADDYAHVSLDARGRPKAVVPETIAGRIELRGFGIVELEPSRWHGEAAVMLAVRLVDPQDTERVSDPDRQALVCGVPVPEILLPAREPVGSVYAVLGRLGLHDRVL